MNYLFFNHHLRDEKSKHKKAVFQDDTGKQRTGHVLEIVKDGEVVARLRSGNLKAATTHKVRAWVETEYEVRVK